MFLFPQGAAALLLFVMVLVGSVSLFIHLVFFFFLFFLCLVIRRVLMVVTCLVICFEGDFVVISRPASVAFCLFFPFDFACVSLLFFPLSLSDCCLRSLGFPTVPHDYVYLFIYSFFLLIKLT